jgi:hypothetical protein
MFKKMCLKSRVTRCVKNPRDGRILNQITIIPNAGHNFCRLGDDFVRDRVLRDGKHQSQENGEIQNASLDGSDDPRASEKYSSCFRYAGK